MLFLAEAVHTTPPGIISFVGLPNHDDATYNGEDTEDDIGVRI